MTRNLYKTSNFVRVFGQVKFFPNDLKWLPQWGFGPNFRKILRPSVSKNFCVVNSNSPSRFRDRERGSCWEERKKRIVFSNYGSLFCHLANQSFFTHPAPLRFVSLQPPLILSTSLSMTTMTRRPLSPLTIPTLKCHFLRNVTNAIFSFYFSSSILFTSLWSATNVDSMKWLFCLWWNLSVFIPRPTLHNLVSTFRRFVSEDPLAK